MTIGPVQRPETQRLAAPDEARQFRSFFTDQVRPDMMGAFLFPGIALGLGCQIQDALGDLVLRQSGPTVQILNRPAILVARDKVHLGVDAGRILTQDLLDPAESLETFLPIEQGKMAQTGKGIADGYLFLCLTIFLTHDEIGHGFLEGAFQPDLDRGQRGSFVVEKIEQLQSKIGTWRGLGFRQFRHQRKEMVRISPVGRNEAVRPEVGDFSFTQLGLGLSGDLLDVFDQYHPKHLGDSPEFSDG